MPMLEILTWLTLALVVHIAIVVTLIRVNQPSGARSGARDLHRIAPYLFGHATQEKSRRRQAAKLAGVNYQAARAIPRDG
jgi:hypothetical protein